MRHFLAEISQSEWVEWKAWYNIRGPIGNPRDDYYRTLAEMNAAMRAGADPAKIEYEKFVQPWLKLGDRREYTSPAKFIRPWIDAPPPAESVGNSRQRPRKRARGR